jgi:NADH-quinone oxidoreductase subunit F
VRAEYRSGRAKRAIAQATARGMLGSNTGKGLFQIKLKEGAGAFVCGEETALIASIEGRRGMPKVRPPFPVESGLWGHPTCINNVETLANIAWILLNGAETYKALGTAGSKGTKVFALDRSSAVVRGSSDGMTINEVIYDIGGGTLLGGFQSRTDGQTGGCARIARKHSGGL